MTHTFRRERKPLNRRKLVGGFSCDSNFLFSCAARLLELLSTLSSVLKSYCPVVTASVGVGGSSPFLLQHQPVLQERNLLRPVQRFQSATVCSCRVSEQACPLYFGPPQAGASRAWASGAFTRLFWTSVEVVAAGRPISAIGSRACIQIKCFCIFVFGIFVVRPLFGVRLV